jgi:hypothetical protein
MEQCLQCRSHPRSREFQGPVGQFRTLADVGLRNPVKLQEKGVL